MLKRMEKDGLVVRKKSSGRSRVEVSLTEAGREVFRQSSHTETDMRIIGALTKRERQRFAFYLLKVRRSALENPLENGPGKGEETG
jgi:DNA-binding MarR family transcriptional regulator